ncbi:MULTISPECIES: DUF956 family protein [Pediococcus]|uniref:DUF956 family protein n=1 Tax=Pediococcus TaxID=1253 RepID=UPI001C1ECC71|nr:MULTISPECIES: DUF956 family protein [Pediococcus]MBU7554399.1 DUF956 family protein [Pediococcus ethanolidurans]MBU7563015.1 DUF956 family protein [Pediococcus ethanolidurans]MCT3034887.1 DUF956 family protein [Pediococcus parvulus]MCT4398472.1 DUF956 family protein [Pediococcus ethanolidurans]MCV3315197.1 DUF956 family protein [Pediococcus ethanolidurans]
MTESINTKIDLKVKATLDAGASQKGKIVIGDKGFEFINNQKNRYFVALPWNEIDHVGATRGIRKGHITHFTVYTKRHIGYVFTARDSKRIFEEIRPYVGAKNLVYEKDMFDRLRHSFEDLTKK